MKYKLFRIPNFFKQNPVKLFVTKSQWRDNYLNLLRYSLDKEEVKEFSIPSEFSIEFDELAVIEILTIRSVINGSKYANQTTKLLQPNDAKELKSRISTIYDNLKLRINQIVNTLDVQGEKGLIRDPDFIGCGSWRLNREIECPHVLIYKLDVNRKRLRIKKVLFHYNDKPKGWSVYLIDIYNRIVNDINTIAFDANSVLVTEINKKFP